MGTNKTKQKKFVNTIPLIPREVWPDPTAVKACSICTSFPEGLLQRVQQQVYQQKETTLASHYGMAEQKIMEERLPESGQRK